LIQVLKFPLFAPALNIAVYFGVKNIYQKSTHSGLEGMEATANLLLLQTVGFCYLRSLVRISDPLPNQLSGVDFYLLVLGVIRLKTFQILSLSLHPPPRCTYAL